MNDERAQWRRTRRRERWAIGLALALLAWALEQGAWAWRIERTLYDLGLALSPRPVPADVLIVAIDDASIGAIGRWPWRRAVHATLLQELAAAKPRAVLLDLVLSEPDPDPAQDRLLAKALRAAAPVVSPLSWQLLPGQAPWLMQPAPELRGALIASQGEVALDADGLVRHAFLRAGVGEQRLPHAALALLQAGGEALSPTLHVERAPIAGALPTWQRDERVAIRYGGPAGHLERVSYVDVLRGAYAAEHFTGKYVLIGMTASGLGDAHATPTSGDRAMPGVEIIGQLMQALRRADAVRTPPASLAGLPSAAAVLLLMLGVARLTQRNGLVVALAAAVLAVGASVLAVGAGWWVNPVGFALAALLVYPLWTWRRLEAVVRALDHEIALHEVEPPAGAQTDATDAERRPARARSGVGQRLGAVREATERLRLARRYLATSLDALPAAVMLGDKEGRVSLANRRAAAMFEAGEAAELHGLSLARLLGEMESVPPLDWPARIAAALERGESTVANARLPEHGDFLVSLVPAPGDGGPRLIATCADVTPIRQAERQREEALAFVSHDLRAPAASIALLAELQQRGMAPMPVDELMREVERLAKRTLELSSAFVSAAQVESKPLVRVRVDLAEVVREIVRDFAPQAAARGVGVDLALAAPAMAQVDRQLVGRAIGNLLGNALRYSPHGGQVEISLAAHGEGWLVSLRDHGPGMTPEQVGALFQAWSQVEAKPAQSGFGLGLLFVRRVAERHRGWVRADSTLGHGACFEFYLGHGADVASR